MKTLFVMLLLKLAFLWLFVDGAQEWASEARAEVGACLEDGGLPSCLRHAGTQFMDIGVDAGEEEPAPSADRGVGSERVADEQVERRWLPSSAHLEVADSPEQEAIRRARWASLLDRAEDLERRTNGYLNGGGGQRHAVSQH